MSFENNQSPFELLLDIDSRAKQLIRNYPVENENREVWSGIAFRISNHELLAPVGDVLEVVTLNSLTRVPGVKPWVTGIANVRGTLIPVLDLKLFLYGKDAQPNSVAAADYRVIIVNYSGHPAGLLVTAVIGIKHYWKDQQVEEVSDRDAVIAAYIKSSYRREGLVRGVFDISRLLEDELFAEVAA